MEKQSVLSQLQQWYASQCDGDWEHGYGVAIGTLDNPGWRLKVDLRGTNLDGRTLAEKTYNYDDDIDWYVVRTADNKFEGAGGPAQLEKMIQEFLEFAGV
ncbi:immunity 53 family protein [Mesorhizobium yinganensis]|uniref:immunity 53 family protein n=1 Tax=Mesorhizobium yinganensis TaxID=3157707 RepID=UPI003CCE2711